MVDYQGPLKKLTLAYPEKIDTKGNFVSFEPLKGVHVLFHNDIENNEYNAWNDKGVDLTKKLTDAINDSKLLNYNPEDKLVTIFQLFIDSFSRIPGFGAKLLEENDIDFPCYDGQNDNIWNILKTKYNVNTNRKLCVYTYGTKFMVDVPKQCQRVFDSSILRGSLANSSEKEGLSYKSLLKLRGTSLKVQEEVRGAELFKSFMENVVKTIEENDYSKIAITCRAGHHRSVSCAEMLVHLYPDRTVNHLTISNSY